PCIRQRNEKKPIKCLNLLARILDIEKLMEKKLAKWLFNLGQSWGRWSEGPGYAPRLFQFALKEKSVHGA
ncbi:MAG TPA: hypothetical protein VFW62_02160, partial [bacterium]|nr:hypothetical protein [bacterium]